jgi:hypothetical protein
MVEGTFLLLPENTGFMGERYTKRFCPHAERLRFTL